MTFANLAAKFGRRLVLAVAVVGAVGIAALPRPASAVSPGAAVGIGLGSFLFGSMLGGAAANPYYSPYYPYGYYPPPPAYYYPPPAYYGPPRRCWNAYYGRYYPC